MTTDEQKFLVGIRQIVAAWVERIGIWVIEPKGILQILTETGLEMKTNSPYSFIHSWYFYSASSSPLLLRGAPNYSADTVLEFHAEASRQL